MKILLRSLCLLLVAISSARAVDVLTQHNNLSRTGANLDETILTPANVNVRHFGKLFARTVDGQIYAQPLYMQGLTIGGRKHNVVFVCTESNSVYAFDADNPADSTPLWHVNLGPPVPYEDVSGFGCNNLEPFIGITSTPVIDTNTGTIYVETKTVEVIGSSNSYFHKLHALDITNGREKFGGPVTIQGTVGKVTFNPMHGNQRAGLLLLSNVVYVAMSSHCDWMPYNGWLFGYNATNLQQVAIFNTTPGSPDGEGAIWACGMAPAADNHGNIYVMAANGLFDAESGGSNYGMCFLKLSTIHGLHVTDWFSPYNEAVLSMNDRDLGSDGPVLLPGTDLMVGMDKIGTLFLVDRNHLGHYTSVPGDPNIVQEFKATAGTDCIGQDPVYWQGPTNQFLFLSSGNGYTEAFDFTGSKIATTPLAVGSVKQADRPGGLSLSANGATNGILWVIDHHNRGTLRAYDAAHMPTELWDSQQDPSRDALGTYNKFTSPTIANGKVYAPTSSGQLVVYGLLKDINAANADSTEYSPEQGRSARGAQPRDASHSAAKDPRFVSLFDGTSLRGWIQDPVNGWTVKDDTIASVGAGRGTLYTAGDYSRYRILFTMRHVSGKPDHQACVLVFCTRPTAGAKGLDALGGIQFQVPNGGHWDYRPGYNNSGKGEFRAFPHPKFDPHQWSRVELLVDATKGIARMAVAQPPGSKAVEVLDFHVPAASRIGPFALQMHNAGLFDEYKDIEIETNPMSDDLITPGSTMPADPPPVAAEPAFKSLRTYLLPAVKNGGFRMDGYMLWCSSVIKVGGVYQMFASRWPAQYGMGGWTHYSECVRATSTNLFGPYQFQQVVLQKRPGHWDNSRVHNVKIVKAGDKYVIFYINTANETGYAASSSITGPWTRSDEPVIRASNPAPLVRPDLSLYVFCRLRDNAGVNRGVAFTAPDYQGPYTVVDGGDNLLPDGCELEDPTIWWSDNQYNILVNDWKSHATGIFKAGAQYYSRDGVHYHLVTHNPIFTKTVVYDDGTSETFKRRERPFVYVNEKGLALALFTACLPEHGPSRIVVQPIHHYYSGDPSFGSGAVIRSNRMPPGRSLEQIYNSQRMAMGLICVNNKLCP